LKVSREGAKKRQRRKKSSRKGRKVFSFAGFESFARALQRIFAPTGKGFVRLKSATD